MAVRSKQKAKKKKLEVAGGLILEEAVAQKIDIIDNQSTYLL